MLPFSVVNLLSWRNATYLTYLKPTWDMAWDMGHDKLCQVGFLTKRREVRRILKVGCLEAAGKCGPYWIPDGVNLGRVLCWGLIAQLLIWMEAAGKMVKT